MTSIDLISHLKTGSTTVCRAWRVVRKDSCAFGFTDHDDDLLIDGLTYSARTGLTARAFQQTTGLSVDNSEAVGAISDDAISEQDISTGRFDDAEVTVYLVNWQDLEQRKILFRGNFGEITRENGSFRVELRGLTERLNVTTGRVYQRSCSAHLGDKKCKIDLTSSEFQAIAIVDEAINNRTLTLTVNESIDPILFENGLLVGVSGPCAGLIFEVREAKISEFGNVALTLWSSIHPSPEMGDTFRLVAGCDKRLQTCQSKFRNAVNFRGFPLIPGDEWLRRPPEQKRKTGSTSTQLFGLPNTSTI